MVGTATIHETKETRETNTKAHITGRYEIDHVSDTKSRDGRFGQWGEQKRMDYESEWEVVRLHFTRIRAACAEKTTDLQIHRIR